MKTPLQLIVILLIINSLFAFTKKKKEIAPPGTVYIRDNFFSDKTEISNIDWREFEHWILAIKKDTLLYEQMLPDTTVWQTQDGGAVLQSYYYRHPAYNFYPVVGVSYEQAAAYCNWRSDVVNELPESRGNSNAGKKYRYRLPTLAEWELIAANKRDLNEYPYGSDSIDTKYYRRGARSFNCKYADKTTLAAAGAKEERRSYTSPVNAYLPNAFGISNLIGNVSEMTETKGIAKGGNYTLYVADCAVLATQQYTRPMPWLGFRCVCEVVNK